MNIFFVRHGESRENKEQIFDTNDSPLTDLGKKQAEFLAERFKNIKLDLIMTSDMGRAVETAETVNKYHQVDIEKTNLIREKKVPTELIGLKENDPKAIEIMSQIKNNIHDESFRHTDQETFEDFKDRVFKFLKLIEKKDVNDILVVGHGFVLRSVVGYILYGDKYSSHDFTRLRDTFLTKNTGVTICEYSKKRGWKILAWNDHAHLAE